MALVSENDAPRKLLLSIVVVLVISPISRTSSEGPRSRSIRERSEQGFEKFASNKEVLRSNHLQQFYNLLSKPNTLTNLRTKREVTSANDLKSLLERLIQDAFNHVEAVYPVVLHGSKCTSRVSVYDGCEDDATPDLKNDPKYSVPVSMTTSNAHFSYEARQVYYGNHKESLKNKVLQDSLCASTDLEQMWQSNMEMGIDSLRWQEFIDSTLGYTLLYPATQEDNTQCADDYDPRLQSWYVNMVSPPKDVVIVIDGTMDTNLRLMKKAASAAVNTLTKNDHGLIIVLSSQSEGKFNETLLKATSTQRDTWLLEVEDLKLSTDDDNLADSVAMGISALQNWEEQRPESCVRALLLFTDRGVDFDVLYKTINENNDDVDIRIFTYTMGVFADDPVAKQIACDNKGAWFSLHNENDIYLVSRYYQLLSESDSSADVLWSELHDFRYEANSKGITGCIPATNTSNNILDIIGVTCVYVQNSLLTVFSDGQQVLSDMIASTKEGCPTNLLTESQLQILRPEASKCTRMISRTAKELREYVENAVTSTASEAERAYQLSKQSAVCPNSNAFYDTCIFPPPNLQYDKDFQRDVTMEATAVHLSWELDQMLLQNSTETDFIFDKELNSSLCMSNLGSKWKEFLEDNRDVKWQFYGDQRERLLRIYPGIQDTDEECSLKDSLAPFRTWFPSAASSPKDVIIIVDSNHEEQSSLMREAIRSLIYTFTRYDYANIITGGTKLYNGLVKTTQDLRSEMLNFTEHISVVHTRNVIGSFERAKSAWIHSKNVGNSSNCVEAVLFLTDSILPDDYLSEIKKISENGDVFRVFTYSFGRLADQSNAWNLACQNQGAWTHIETLYDIWDLISDYYNYFSSYEQTSLVIWSEVYEDRYGLGSVLSGCLPVYDIQTKHITLLGVVCVDILQETLDSYPDGKKVFDSMMGGERRCPAVQLTEDQIEELRMGSTKCDRHEFNDTKGMQRYTEDSLRRLAASAQSIYEQITETGSSGNYCPFDTEIHEVCRSDPPMGTTRPEVPYPQKIIGESTVLLVAEDSAKLQGDYKNLLLPNKLYSSMCMSQSFVESWNKYAQIAYHYFVGQKPDSSYARVFPDVIFGQDTDACNKRDELVKRLQKETDLTSRLNSKNVMIVLQYEDESSLSLMKNTIHAIADDLTPMDQIGMVTSAGTHHDSQMELFTRENEMQFLNFIDDMMYSEPIRDIRDTVEEGFTVLKANKHGCSFALIILTDTLLKQGLVQTVEEQNKNFNSTVFVYLYGYAATDMYARDVAIETACTNAGAWDIMPSEVLAADRVKNYLKFLPTNLNSVILPVWFESQYDLLMPDVSSNAMVSCMPILSGSALLGTLCDYIAMETIEQFSDSSEVLVSLRNNTTTCMRVYLTEDELNDIRRVGAKCKTPEPKVLTAGGIVGIVLMVVGVVALVVVIVYICIKKRTYDKIYYFFKSPLRLSSYPSSNRDYVDGSFLLVSEDEDRY